MKVGPICCSLLIFLVLIPVTGRSQDKNITRGNQQWVQYYNQTKLAEKWSLLVDGGYRWKDDLIHRSQYLVRASGRYNLNDRLSVAAGFAHLGTYTDIEITSKEFRPYQEIVFTHGEVLGLNHRFRVEQRFVQATVNHDQQFDRFNWRFRYFLGISIPLLSSSKHPSRNLKLQVGDEIFINAGEDIIYNIFDQNRLLVGPAFQLNESLTFTLTYNGNFSALNLPSEYTFNHILWLGVRHKMDLVKSKQQ